MILIVDDNHDNIFSLKSLLILNKFETDTASSGEEALKKILQRDYSLVILDVQMPDMDGFEVAEAISGYSKSKNIPIIFLSAISTQKKFITKGYNSGGIDYVTKPFDPDILLLKVKTFYRLSEQARKLSELEKNLRQEIESRKQAGLLLERKVEERTSELTKINKQLEQSNRDLAQFAFIASHDLQEPLRKIETFSNLVLKKDLDQSKAKSYLQRISYSASRLRDLITDLLNYSRINAEDNFKKTNLNSVIEETLEDLEINTTGDRTNIKIGRLPEIEVIPSQMRQVFQNLISNSLKFCRTGVPCNIVVTGERVATREINSVPDPSGDYFRLTMTDNGIGFNNEYNNRIFDIFQRLNHAELYEGSGIGLAIVKKIIERHDGIIAAIGEENEGATFIIILPVSHGEQIPKKISQKRIPG
jgi:light-regulated signal transduction histidine kinase (bacteriophytochrome)